MSKIQFNATTGKKFRATMGKYFDAVHAINDYVLGKSAAIKAYNAAIAADADDVNAILMGSYQGIRVLADIQADMLALTEKRDAILADVQSVKDKQAKFIDAANDLVGKDLHTAYVSGDFASAIADFFKANGFADATPENCAVYATLIGVKKASAMQSCKTGKLTTKMSFNQFRDLFLRILADSLCENACFKAYAYKFVPPTKQDK